MATISECRAAVDRLAENLARNAEASGKLDLDRPVSLNLTDLGTGFHGRFRGGRLIDITDGIDPRAKITLSATSDDLIALIDGKIHFAQAWASGRISVKASIFDLMKLRTML